MQIQNIKAYLANNNMTFKEFGELIDFSPVYIGNVSRGHVAPGRKFAKVVKEITNGEIDLFPRVKQKEQKKKTGKKITHKCEHC